MFISILNAQECVASSGQTGGAGLGSFVPIIIIFFIFYFIMIMPQQKKMKEHEKMISELKKGDNVLLSSGIYGTITNIKDNILEIKIAENVKINVLKTTVSQVIKDEQTKNN